MHDTEDRDESPALTSELDLDIQRALARGRTSAAGLPTRAWMALNQVVEADGLSLQVLLARGDRGGALPRWRTRRELKRLLALGYVRREGERVFPTVSGIGAIRPYMSTDPTSSAFPALRERRRQELAAERTAPEKRRGAETQGRR